MKKFFWFISIAAVALGIASCTPEEKPDITGLTEDGFYVALDPSGATAVSEKEMMANGINEADNQSLREGMYEKYIVLEANKEFSLAYISGGKMTLYGAELSEFKPESLEGIYDSNPADAVFKGKLVIGDSAPKMKVSKKGLYHIVLDLNKKNDLADAQIVLCPVTMGVRGGMNSWGFTAFDATEPSNEGITYTLSGQKLADGGEFKFAYNSAWKITLDAEGNVKANTNLGAGCKPGGDNIAVTEGAGVYKITLNYKLAAGEIAKSFSYTIEQESKSETPTTMYMIGQDFGGWDWNNAGVAELVPVWGKEGAFWCTRYFTTNGFKFCALREWNGDFTGLGSDEGYTVADGNCFVPAEGMYTVYINLLDKVLEIKPAEVYGLGDAVFTGGWDFDTAQKAEIVDGKAVITTKGAGELRLASKVIPTNKVEGCGDHGWYDWWKTEFIFFSDNKIAYRGGGNDQDRVQIEAGKKIIIDFNNGTVAVEDGAASNGITTAEAFIAWMANPTAEAELGADITLPESYVPGDFAGTFDGKGHTVTYNLNVPADAAYNSGLFSKVTGTVKNLKVAGTLTSVAATASNVGGIAGATTDDGAVFENCESSVVIATPVKASFRIGGIVGLGGKNLTIKNCVNNGEISHAVADMGSANAIQLGGIVGHLEATGSVIGCTNNGKLIFSGKGTPRIGGMCGYFNNLEEGLFENCTNNAEILVASNATSGYNYVGGITGYYGTPVNASHVAYKSCVNNGNITHTDGVASTSDRFGGILCHCGGTAVDVNQPISVEVIDCSNSGNLVCSGATAKNHIGGIVGFTETITCIIKCSGCTNTGSITVEGNGYIGSLLGYSCNPASTFENFTVGKDVVMKGGESANAGIVIGSGYVSTAAIPNAELSTALTGKVEGGKIVKGDVTTELNAENYKAWIAPRGFVGSTDGVTFSGGGSAAPADVNIKIDGNFDDWASVPGAEPANVYKAFKVWNDANNFYFYVETDPGSRLWSGGGYLYLYFDWDNNHTTGEYSGTTGMNGNNYEAYTFMYIFENNKVGAPRSDSVAKGLKLDNIQITGSDSSAEVVKIEMSIPRADFDQQVKAGDVIGVDSYRSKDGGNVYFPGYVVK